MFFINLLYILLHIYCIFYYISVISYCIHYKINQRMKILNSDFLSLIRSRIGSATSVPRGENIKRAVATSKFCSILFKLHNLVPMVNYHQQELEQLD